MARDAYSIFSYAVMNITREPASWSAIRSIIVSPSISGICMSESTISGRCFSISSIPSFPSEALPISLRPICSHGMVCSSACTARRLSSIIRTVNSICQHPPLSQVFHLFYLNIIAKLPCVVKKFMFKSDKAQKDCAANKGAQS